MPYAVRYKKEPLRSILIEWANCVQAYFDLVEEPPYWLTERANVSLLAAGATKAGCVAMEAFSQQKGKGRSAYSGRQDLWIAKGKDELNFEAKMSWPHLVNWSPREVETALRKACKDAERLGQWSDLPRRTRMGITFVAPYIARSRLPVNWRRTLTANFRKFGREALAYWHSPESKLKFCLGDDNRLYPAVCILGREV